MSRYICILLMLFFIGSVNSVEAKSRKKSCPKHVMSLADNYRGHKCPPKRKVLLAKYY